MIDSDSLGVSTLTSTPWQVLFSGMGQSLILLNGMGKKDVKL